MATAQRYAAAAYEDGLTESTIRDMASLACWGKHQNNVERDLHRWMPYAHNSGLTNRHSTSIEVYNPDTAKIEQQEIPLLLASDVLHALWKKQDPKLWDISIGATSATCGEFWQYAEDDWAATHPVVELFGCVSLVCFYFPGDGKIPRMANNGGPFQHQRAQARPPAVHNSRALANGFGCVCNRWTGNNIFVGEPSPLHIYGGMRFGTATKLTTITGVHGPILNKGQLNN